MFWMWMDVHQHIKQQINIIHATFLKKILFAICFSWKNVLFRSKNSIFCWYWMTSLSDIYKLSLKSYVSNLLLALFLLLLHYIFICIEFHFKIKWVCKLLGRWQISPRHTNTKNLHNRHLKSANLASLLD